MRGTYQLQQWCEAVNEQGSSLMPHIDCLHLNQLHLQRATGSTQTNFPNHEIHCTRDPATSGPNKFQFNEGTSKK